MAYAIMRIEKISGKGNLASSVAHAKRERETPNADPERTPENKILVEYDKEQTDKEIEQARTRKDNVIMYDIFAGTSPEFMENATPEQKEEWQKRTMDWAKDEFGAENIKSAVLHTDEKTEHLQIHVMPRDERGKLNAKKWTGGKQKLQELQDRYAERIKDLGLERGERGSKAKHQEVQQFYGLVKESQTLEKEVDQKEWKHLNPPKPTMADRLNIEEYREKVGLAVRDQMMEREKKHLARIKTLEVDRKANRANIRRFKELDYKLTTVSHELGKEKSERVKYQNFFERLQDLNRLNPKIWIEVDNAKEMEFNRKPPDERIYEIDKQLRKDGIPKEQYQKLIEKRIQASQELSDNRAKERALHRGHDRGGMER